MSEQHMNQPLRTLAFAQPTHCRRYDWRVAVVTGAAQGLCRGVAKRLAEEGAKLVVCDIQEDALRSPRASCAKRLACRCSPSAGISANRA
jgi:NAD(P)-dependent dehydrogenase (short-subunit alcohol dehydrogenase family)